MKRGYALKEKSKGKKKELAKRKMKEMNYVIPSISGINQVNEETLLEGCLVQKT